MSFGLFPIIVCFFTVIPFFIFPLCKRDTLAAATHLIQTLFMFHELRLTWEGALVCRIGQSRIYTPYEIIYGDFPAKNTVYTPYIIYIWF